MRDEPDKALVEAKLANITRIIGQTMQKALTTSSDFFQPGMDFDWTLFTVRARYEAFALFRLTHLETSEDPDPIKTQTISNIGLQLYYDEILIKILKGRELPVPTTISRVRFYDNMETQVVVDGKNDLRQAKLNVVYLWDCDIATKEFAYFSLVCPKSGGLKREEVSSFWEIPLAIPERQIVKPPTKNLPTVLADLDFAPIAPEAPAVNDDMSSSGNLSADPE